MNDARTLAQTERECSVITGHNVWMELPVDEWLAVRDEIVAEHGPRGLVARLSLGDVPHYMVKGVPVVVKGVVA